MPSGRQAILEAFDQLFDAAAARLQIHCSPEERAEMRTQFEQRMQATLEAVDAAPTPVELPDAVLADMRQAIETLSPAELASLVAAIPLAQRTHEMLRSIAFERARERLLEHLTSQADSRYGGH